MAILPLILHNDFIIFGLCINLTVSQKSSNQKLAKKSPGELIEFIESFKGDIATKTDLQLLKDRPGG